MFDYAMYKNTNALTILPDTQVYLCVIINLSIETGSFTKE